MAKETRILITGGGGPAAITFMRALSREGRLQFFVADTDPHAAGLYLVPPDRRFLVPHGESPDFIAELLWICGLNRIDVLVPTVDCELLPVAESADRFEQIGTRVLVSTSASLRTSLDKLKTLEACQDIVPVPRFAIFDQDFSDHHWPYPLVVKPRLGSGSRGVIVVEGRGQLDSIERDSGLIVQEFLPGEEYSVDVLTSKTGTVIAAVPRTRLKVDSGVTVTGRTFHDPQLESLAISVVKRLGVRFVANVQFRRRGGGEPVLLEVNARLPGAMCLTVASGVNMPLMSLQDLTSTAMSPPTEPFQETAMIRVLQERYFNPGELMAMEEQKEQLTQNLHVTVLRRGPAITDASSAGELTGQPSW